MAHLYKEMEVSDKKVKGDCRQITLGGLYKTNEGEIFKVIKLDGYYKNLIEFQDELKYQRVANLGHIRNGTLKNPNKKIVQGVGYFGVGKYTGNTVEYSTWHDMISRCYSEHYIKKRPAYKGCTVCDEWHNFQVFAEWYTKQDFYGLGYHLDKDILFRGNKIYSPETCCLVPREINTVVITTQRKSSKLPTGVRATRGGKFVAKIKSKGLSKHIGTFDTPIDAHKAYIIKKKSLILETAILFKDKIEDRVYQALVNWEFSMEEVYE